MAAERAVVPTKLRSTTIRPRTARRSGCAAHCIAATPSTFPLRAPPLHPRRHAGSCCGAVLTRFMFRPIWRLSSWAMMDAEAAARLAQECLPPDFSPPPARPCGEAEPACAFRHKTRRKLPGQPAGVFYWLSGRAVRRAAPAGTHGTACRRIAAGRKFSAI